MANYLQRVVAAGARTSGQAHLLSSGLPVWPSLDLGKRPTSLVTNDVVEAEPNGAVDDAVTHGPASIAQAAPPVSHGTTYSPESTVPAINERIGPSHGLPDDPTLPRVEPPQTAWTVDAVRARQASATPLPTVLPSLVGHGERSDAPREYTPPATEPFATVAGSTNPPVETIESGGGQLVAPSMSQYDRSDSRPSHSSGWPRPQTAALDNAQAARQLGAFRARTASTAPSPDMGEISTPHAQRVLAASSDVAAETPSTSESPTEAVPEKPARTAAAGQPGALPAVPAHRAAVAGEGDPRSSISTAMHHNSSIHPSPLATGVPTVQAPRGLRSAVDKPTPDDMAPTTETLLTATSISQPHSRGDVPVSAHLVTRRLAPTPTDMTVVRKDGGSDLPLDGQLRVRATTASPAQPPSGIPMTRDGDQDAAGSQGRAASQLMPSPAQVIRAGPPDLSSAAPQQSKVTIGQLDVHVHNVAPTPAVKRIGTAPPNLGRDGLMQHDLDRFHLRP